MALREHAARAASPTAPTIIRPSNKAKVAVSAIVSNAMQVAWCPHRAHHHRRRENQIPIAPAAQPASNFPRLRALALFGRRTPEREACHRHRVVGCVGMATGLISLQNANTKALKRVRISEANTVCWVDVGGVLSTVPARPLLVSAGLPALSCAASTRKH